MERTEFEDWFFLPVAAKPMAFEADSKVKDLFPRRNRTKVSYILVSVGVFTLCIWTRSTPVNSYKRQRVLETSPVS